MEKQKASLRQEFESTPDTIWRARIEKDLKGKSFETLLWEVEEKVRMQPYYRAATQQAHELAPAVVDWAICEQFIIDETSFKAQNAQLMDALMGGVEGFVLQYSESLSSEQFAKLFASIQLDILHIHHYGKAWVEDAQTLGEQLYAYCKAEGVASEKLTGSVAALDASLADWGASAAWWEEHFPKLRPCIIDVQALHNESYSVQLAEVLFLGAQAIERFLQLGYDIQSAANKIQFTFGIGKTYFPELAKLRAFKHLWMHMLVGYGLTETASIAIHVQTYPSHDDKYQNMIEAATQAMSAAMAQVGSLSVMPATGYADATHFDRRMARNVQHLLKMEAHLDKVEDPAAGSYYIEMLTAQLAEKAWTKFRLSYEK